MIFAGPGGDEGPTVSWLTVLFFSMSDLFPVMTMQICAAEPGEQPCRGTARRAREYYALRIGEPGIDWCGGLLNKE